MQEEIQEIQKIYAMIAEFFVNYSFQLIGAVIILLVGLFIANRVARAVERLLARKNVDITLRRFLGSCTKIAIMIGVAVICLNKIGISVTPFLAAIGAISLGAGLAVQGLLSNYGAGFNIILTRPFVIGDTISVCGVTGVVKDIRLAYTVLSDEDEVTITIPNRHIIGEIIHNSRSSKLAETTVGVAYGSDPQQVIDVILSVLQQQGEPVSRNPQVGIDNFGDSSLDFGVRFWVPTEQFHQQRFAINNSIYRALEQAGIQIPFPQREVRLLNSATGETVTGETDVQ